MKLLINLMFLRAVPLGFIQEPELCLADCSSSLTQTHYHKIAIKLHTTTGNLTHVVSKAENELDLPPLRAEAGDTYPYAPSQEAMTALRARVKPWCPNEHTTPNRGRHPGILHDMASAASTARVDPPTAPSPIEPAQPLAAAPSAEAWASLLELVESTSQSA